VRIKVFVSYSHHDRKFLAEDSLLGFLKGLEREGVEFWSDARLVAGDKWDDEIKQRVKDADIALVLVSQWFLDSAYCIDVEISGFLEACRDHGLIIFPIIISACKWEKHEWLRTRQFLPRDKKTVRKHFVDRGRREELFSQVREDLMKQIAGINESRNAFHLITKTAENIVDNVNSILNKDDFKGGVTDDLVNLLKEFSKTHSNIVEHVEPLLNISQDRKKFRSDFIQYYRIYREFRFKDSFQEARMRCSTVPNLLMKLESSLKITKVSPAILHELSSSFKELADYNYVLEIWEKIFSLIDTYCDKANDLLKSGITTSKDISEAISVMDDFRHSVDKSYRESLEALKNMDHLVNRITMMYG